MSQLVSFSYEALITAAFGAKTLSVDRKLCSSVIVGPTIVGFIPGSVSWFLRLLEFFSLFGLIKSISIILAG